MFITNFAELVSFSSLELIPSRLQPQEEKSGKNPIEDCIVLISPQAECHIASPFFGLSIYLSGKRSKICIHFNNLISKLIRFRNV
jgi:hypothetical protein